MILIVDNYDSFTYNLYQLIGSINEDIKVIKNDELTANEINELSPSHIIISPGPGYPKDAGYIESIIKELNHIPILGVCLGHQAICDVYGATITHANKLMHGKKDKIKINNKCSIFKGLDECIEVARYHSLIAVDIPNELEVISIDDNNEIMAVKHRKYKTYGLQFHPESIMTPTGKQIIENFLKER